MDEQPEIPQTKIELTEAVQTSPAQTADNIALSHLGIYYGQLDNDGLPKNFVEIYLSLTGKDTPASKRTLTLTGAEADWFVNAVHDLAITAIMGKLGISEELRK